MNNKVNNFINLGRFNKPLGALLLAWPCTWGVMIANPEINSLIFYNTLFFFSAFIMRAAGCAWNDILDRNIDRMVERTKYRPIAAKTLSITEGLLFIIICLVFGLFTLLFLPTKAIVICLISIPFIILYPLTKRITFFPQFCLGITFNIGILIGYTAISNEYFSLPSTLLYLGAICWTIAYDTIYAIQDYKDDKKNNIKSTATLMNKFSGKFAAIFYLFSTILFFFAIELANFGNISKTTILISGVWQFYYSYKINVNDHVNALKGFQISTLCGGILFVAMFLDIIM